MTTRAQVLDTLSRLAFGYEFLGEQRRRASAYGNAVRTLKKLPNLVADHAAGELGALPGIGAGILGVVDAVLAGEPVDGIVELEARIPPSLFEARKLRGIGPKKLRTLHDALGVTSISEIEYACNENRLLALPGFGPKTQAKVLESIALIKARAGRYRLDQAMAAAEAEVQRLAALEGVSGAQVAGDARRAVEVCTQGDVVAVISVAAEQALSQAAGEGAAWETDDDGLRALRVTVDGVPVRIVNAGFADVLGVVSLWATGSAAHRDALADHAEAQGMLLGPVGLYAGHDRVPCADEDAVYAALGLHPTPPERREADVPLVGVGAARPRLVRMTDLRGALHNHTTASDGVHTLDEMHAAATALGLAYLGISEHSQTASYAGGLQVARLLDQTEAVRHLNAAGTGCTVLTGIESDILADGALDYPPEVLSHLDMVIASVHTRHRLDRAAFTARMVTAARQPWTDIIGHPTGRLILGRAASDFDVVALLDACADSGCAVELNANPQRLDLNAEHLAMARERGLLVSISADAHSTAALSHLEWGVRIARRAGLVPEDVLNCRGLDDLRTWLTARKLRARAASGLN